MNYIHIDSYHIEFYVAIGLMHNWYMERQCLQLFSMYKYYIYL